MPDNANNNELKQRIEDLERDLERLAEREKWLLELIESIPDVIYFKDVDGRYLFVNQAFEKIVSKPRGDIIGKFDSQLLPQDLSAQAVDSDKKTLAKRAAVRYEQVLTDHGGETTFFDTLKFPVFGCRGEIKGLGGVSRDITQNKQLAAALKESEKNFKALADNSSDGMLIAMGDGRHVYANKRASEILGYSESELLQTTIKDLAHPDEYEKVKKRYYSILKGGSFPSHYETVAVRKDAKEVPVEVASALTSWYGQPADLVAIRDISDRKKMQNELKEARDELEQRVKKRTKELENQKMGLQELNTAMKVLLEKRKEDRIKFEDNVLANTKELIGPLLASMKQTELDEHQKMILNIIEANLDEITSNFTRKLSLKHLNLTATEIKIANYIKYGTTTKKIAELMKSSPRTIETHRKNIRAKIGLRQKRENLRSYLLSLH